MRTVYVHFQHLEPVSGAESEVYWKCSTYVFFMVSRYIYDESEFIVALLTPL